MTPQQDSAIGLSAEELELLRADFGTATKNAVELREESLRAEADPNRSFAFASALANARFVENSQLVWFRGRYNHRMEELSQPRDYLAIRDDYEALKSFVHDLLAEGRTAIHTRDGDESNPAQYLAWMHGNSTNQKFKTNLECAVLELLTTELARQPKPLTECRQEAEQEFEKNSYMRVSRKRLVELLGRDAPPSALWRLHLDYPKSEEGQRLREKFLQAAGVTERPITDEEVFKTYGGTREHLEELIKQGRFKDTTLAHYQELPQELITELVAWTNEAQLQRLTAQAFAPQFAMLAGLSDFVQMCAANSTLLKDAVPLLQSALMEQHYFTAPILEFGLSKVDLYASLQLSLARLQPGPELREFWLDLLRREDQADRLAVSAYGLFMTAPNRAAKRQLIPQILALTQEKEGLFATHAYTDGAGFLHTYKPYEALFAQVSQSCFSGARFYRYDPDTPALRILTGWSLHGSSYDLAVSVYTPAGIEHQHVRYDLTSGAEQDLGPLQSFAQEFLESGYPVSRRIGISSFNARRIMGTEPAMVIDGGDRDLSGAVEGVIGIGGNNAPFFYHSADGTLLFGRCLDSSFMPAMRSGLSKNRFDFSQLKQRTPIAELLPWSGFVGQIREDAKTKRSQGRLFDSTYYLEKHLTVALEDRLRTIVGVLCAKLPVQQVDAEQHHQSDPEL